MACNGCHWIATIFEWCGFKIEDKTTNDDADTGAVFQKYTFDNFPQVDVSIDGSVLTDTTKECQKMVAVASASCPEIIDSGPGRLTKEDFRTRNNSLVMNKSRHKTYLLHPRLFSDSKIDIHSKTITSPIINRAYVGDGKYANVAENRSAKESNNALSEINEIEVGDSEIGADKETKQITNGCRISKNKMQLQGNLTTFKDSKLLHIDQLKKYISPTNHPQIQQNITFLSYQVLLGDVGPNYMHEFRTKENDVEMTDLSSQNQKNDVDMFDLSQEGNKMQQGENEIHTYRMDVLSDFDYNIDISGSSTSRFVSGDHSSSLNVVTPVTFTPNSGQVETTANPCSGQENVGTLRSQDTMLLVELPKITNASSVRWNEAVKIIYFNPSSKLRNSAWSADKRQDLVGWDILPLNDTPKGSRSNWVNVVKHGLIRGDLHPSHVILQLNSFGQQEDDSCDDDCSYSSMSTSSEDD